MSRSCLFSLWFCIALFTGLFPFYSEASIACNSTYNPCEQLFWNGSECRNGFCSNPFEKGCLHTLLNSPGDIDISSSMNKAAHKRLSSLIERLKSQVRVCNSDDPPGAADQGLCVSHYTESSKNYHHHNYQNHNHNPESMQRGLFAEYPETRIYSQNWESSFFASWILQIVLSEILQVPTTIESGTQELSQWNNFYDPEARLGYGEQNIFDALRVSSEAEGSDCSKVQADAAANGEDYKPCAHVVLEFWTGSSPTYQEHLAAGVVEPLQPLGAIGLQGIFGTDFSIVGLETCFSSRCLHNTSFLFCCPI